MTDTLPAEPVIAGLRGPARRPENADGHPLGGGRRVVRVLLGAGRGPARVALP
jgi:hypothetical protein